MSLFTAYLDKSCKCKAGGGCSCSKLRKFPISVDRRTGTSQYKYNCTLFDYYDSIIFSAFNLNVAHSMKAM